MKIFFWNQQLPVTLLPKVKCSMWHTSVEKLAGIVLAWIIGLWSDCEILPNFHVKNCLCCWILKTCKSIVSQWKIHWQWTSWLMAIARSIFINARTPRKIACNLYSLKNSSHGTDNIRRPRQYQLGRKWKQ